MKTSKLHLTLGLLAGLSVLSLIFYLLYFAPADYRSDKYLFNVAPGYGLNQIIAELHAEGYVRSQLGPRIAFLFNPAAKVQAGTYNISPRMNAWAIADILSSGETATERVTVPEGYTVAQIADLLNSKNIIDLREFNQAASSFPPDYEFLKSRPGGQGLEGYLFPDTYNIDKGTPAIDILNLFLTTFEKRIQPLLSSVEASKYNLHQTMTLASLVEKEARTEVDRRLVAGVILNRLDQNMRLDVDATVRYLTNNWEDPITQADLNINSPYNTRKVAGLPPGPICNPGLAAIQAVLSPTKSDYLYYLTDNDGITHYAKTLSDHNANKAKYLS